MSALLSHVLPRRLVEVEWVVSGLPELSVADPTVHAALRGRSALSVRRGSEAAAVIKLWAFPILFYDLFGCLAWGYASLCVCLVA